VESGYNRAQERLAVELKIERVSCKYNKFFLFLKILIGQSDKFFRKQSFSLTLLVGQSYNFFEEFGL